MTKFICRTGNQSNKAGASSALLAGLLPSWPNGGLMESVLSALMEAGVTIDDKAPKLRGA